MLFPNNGEIWRIRIDDELRRVKVIAAVGVGGWWRCVDLATDIYVLAPETCFVEPERSARRLRCSF